MTLSTSALRRVWAPACAPKGSVFLAAYAALDACLRAHRYAPRAKDTGAYNCRQITGGKGYSLHAYGPADRFTFWNGVTIATALAVDINWTTNPYGPRLVTDMPRAMVDAVKAVRTNSGAQVWRWGGDYATNKDAMHFEIVCTPSDLRTGIDPDTLPGASPGTAAARILRRGASGQDVLLYQVLLNQIHGKWPEVPSVEPDGEYGPATEAAVLAFERMHNRFLSSFDPTKPRLQQDGVATLATQKALVWWAEQARKG